MGDTERADRVEKALSIVTDRLNETGDEIDDLAVRVGLLEVKSLVHRRLALLTLQILDEELSMVDPPAAASDDDSTVRLV